jgi:hypothetical protein
MKIGLSWIAGAAALCVTVAFSPGALAAPSCKADVDKFCAQVKPGGGRIVQCLKQNEPQLSDSCKERMKMAQAEMKEIKDACADDVQQYCAGMKPGGGRIANCLKDHKDKLSAECKTALEGLREKKQ